MYLFILPLKKTKKIQYSLDKLAVSTRGESSAKDWPIGVIDTSLEWLEATELIRLHDIDRTVRQPGSGEQLHGEVELANDRPTLNL